MLWYLIPLAIIAAIFKSAAFKGVMGEAVVNLSAQLLLDKEKYHLIKNVTLPVNGSTTQIDHIIVSVYGIFVVETKNMKGWIHGNEHRKTWTQNIYGKKHAFQNPLHQNYKHLMTLQSLLDIDENKLFSLVVFIGESEFKTEMPDNVTYGRGYIRFIESKSDILFSGSEVKEMIDKIEMLRLEPSFKTNFNHINNLNIRNTTQPQSVSCPKCGGDMVLRKAKRGSNAGKQFWGCIKFPKCKGTRDYL